MQLYDWRKIAFIAVMVLAASAVRADIDWVAVTLNADYSAGSYQSSLRADRYFYIFTNKSTTGPPTAEVWRTYNGIDWTAMTRNAGYGYRVTARNLWHDNYIYSITGYAPLGGCDADGYCNDCWRSSNGADWTALTRNAEFPARNDGAVIKYDDKLWVIAGHYKTGFYADIWNSTDGIEWTALTLAAEFGERAAFGCVVFDDKLWIIGGYSGEGVFKDVWNSSDGIEWTAVTLNAEFGEVSNMGAVVVGNKIYIVGGNDTNKVWYTLDGAEWIAETDGDFSTRYYVPLETNGYNLVVFGGSTLSSGINDVWVGNIVAGTPTPTRTVTPYHTRTITPTRTATVHTATNTPSVTRTITHTITATPTRTEIPSKTDTPTVTETVTDSPTSTHTETITETWTITETHTNTPTFTVTLTPTTVETLMIWYNSTDTDWHKTDIRISARQYPDTADNRVTYTLYGENISNAIIYPFIAIMPNEDDINPAWNVCTWDYQGLNYGDTYSLTLTAEGGDLGVEYMSNNIVVYVGPTLTPTLTITPTVTPTPE